MARLHWAEDNLGKWDEFSYESFPWCSIDLLTNSPVRYNWTTDAPLFSEKDRPHTLFLHHVMSFLNGIGQKISKASVRWDKMAYMWKYLLPICFKWFTSFKGCFSYLLRLHSFNFNKVRSKWDNALSIRTLWGSLEHTQSSLNNSDIVSNDHFRWL